MMGNLSMEEYVILCVLFKIWNTSKGEVIFCWIVQSILILERNYLMISNTIQL